MQAWDKRPLIVANLLNPSFCGEIIRRFINSYYNESKMGCPFSLLYLVLPMILHKTTRQVLPKTTRKAFHEWIEENPTIRIGFSNRCEWMIPFVKEALIFMMQYNAIAFSEQGRVVLKTYKKNQMYSQGNDEILECFGKSELLGKWFAKSGNEQTIYSLLGVKP